MDNGTLEISVVCFLWGGWGKPFEIDYVNRLYSAVKKNTTRQFSFYCFTDEKERRDEFNPDIFLIEFEPIWMWNFNKMKMYDPFYGFRGMVFCFDLDVVIAGSLDDILGYKGCFASCEGAYTKGRIGGSLVAFPAQTCARRFLYQRLLIPIAERHPYFAAALGGSERRWYQRQLGKIDFWQDLFPGQVLSYKVDCKDGLPEDARVVRFHGFPRPHEVVDKWVKNFWEGA